MEPSKEEEATLTESSLANTFTFLPPPVFRSALAIKFPNPAEMGPDPPTPPATAKVVKVLPLVLEVLDIV